MSSHEIGALHELGTRRLTNSSSRCKHAPGLLSLLQQGNLPVFRRVQGSGPSDAGRAGRRCHRVCAFDQEVGR